MTLSGRFNMALILSLALQQEESYLKEIHSVKHTEEAMHKWFW